MRKVSFFGIFFLFVCSNPARGDTMCPVNDNIPPIPDASGWTVNSKSRIEIRISSNVVSYLGLDTELTGGDNSEKESKEFLRTVSRHIPAIFVRSQFGDKRSFLR